MTTDPTVGLLREATEPQQLAEMHARLSVIFGDVWDSMSDVEIGIAAVVMRRCDDKIERLTAAQVALTSALNDVLYHIGSGAPFERPFVDMVGTWCEVVIEHGTKTDRRVL